MIGIGNNVEIRETHVSLLLFLGERVLKIAQTASLRLRRFLDTEGSGRGLPTRGGAQPPTGT